ncbi:MAG TPA: hypothetical protein VGK16_12740 [Candidatus Limnocylindrales bacterium]|jgi:hypothetical protein
MAVALGGGTHLTRAEGAEQLPISADDKRRFPPGAAVKVREPNVGSAHGGQRACEILRHATGEEPLGRVDRHGGTGPYPDDSTQSCSERRGQWLGGGKGNRKTGDPHGKGRDARSGRRTPDAITWQWRRQVDACEEECPSSESRDWHSRQDDDAGIDRDGNAADRVRKRPGCRTRLDAQCSAGERDRRQDPGTVGDRSASGRSPRLPGRS